MIEPMNLLTMIIDAVFSFIRRNPIFCLVVLILAIGAPSLLAGIASFVLYAIVALVVLMIILSLVFRWRIAKLADNIDREQRRQRSEYPDGSRNEGDVRIHMNSDTAEKRINDDVGDYVDFEEEKNS